eukprot:24166-Eustigmatos_ZCMA.PRE.1
MGASHKDQCLSPRRQSNEWAVDKEVPKRGLERGVAGLRRHSRLHMMLENGLPVKMLRLLQDQCISFVIWDSI